MRAQDADCYLKTWELLGQLHNYQERALESENTEKAFSAIQFQLEDIKRNHSACYPYVFNNYVIGTMLVLFSHVNWQQNGSFYVLTEFPDFHFHGLFQVTTFLAHHNVFKPLDEDTRKKAGGLYTLPVSKDDATALVMGAYGCESSAIWLDPTLRPYDFAGSALHEMSHLMRDKFGAPENRVLDELLSALNGSWAQFRLQHDLNRRQENRTTRGGHKFLRNLKSDLTLFAKKGTLHRTWKHMVREEGTEKSAPISKLFAYLNSDKHLDSFSKAVEVIASVYQSAYESVGSKTKNEFEQESAKSSFKKAVADYKSDVTLDPLQLYIQKLGIQDPAGLAALADVDHKKVYHLDRNPFPDEWTYYLLYSESLKSPPGVLDQINAQLSQPSHHCKNDDGTPLGVEGGRPELKDKDPLGVEGGRPELKTARPCLHLEI